MINSSATHAILDENNVVILCGERKWITWWCLKGGERRSRIKATCIGIRVVETTFTGRSLATDGPHLFWQVHLATYAKAGSPSDIRTALLSEIDSIFATRCDTL